MTSDNAGHRDEYDDAFVARLELLWGEGFLSPGGAEEVAELLGGFDLAGKAVLDIGCGIGGVDVVLARDHGAGSVLGIDVEAPLLTRARALAERLGLDDRIETRLVRPGPLPLADGAFDVVVSKDAMIHIPDKPALFAEVRRVLRPGGGFIASDWLQSAEGRGSPEMTSLGAALGLSFNLATPEEMAAAMAAAGFRGHNFARPQCLVPGSGGRGTGPHHRGAARARDRGDGPGEIRQMGDRPPNPDRGDRPGLPAADPFARNAGLSEIHLARRLPICHKLGMATDYDKLYQKTNRLLGAPGQAFVDFFETFEKERALVLDIGCGQGRDALFIARLGHRVTAVDLSPAGVDDLMRGRRPSQSGD